MNGENWSYDVKFWNTGIRPNRPTPYRVRWVVAGQVFSDSFTTSGLADAFRSQLVTLARSGEPFSTEEGLPRSLLRKYRDVSFLVHAREYAAFSWKDAAGKRRVSILETLSRVVPVVTRNIPGAPDPGVLRSALRKDLNQGAYGGQLDDAERKALAWLERASRPVSAFENDSVVCDVLDALAVNLDGTQAAPEYFSRRRRILHRVLGYAVRKQRLEKNPLSKGNLPESWTPPQAPDDAIDPRCVGSPALITEMLTACSYVGRRQGPRFVAFYGCMYYAMMRPAEVAALTRDGCHLPEHAWGRLTFTDSSTAAGKAVTTTGGSTSTAGSKAGPRAGRPSGRRARRPARQVPVPPELVTLLRLHDRPGRRLDRPHERRPAPARPAAQGRPQDRRPMRGRPGMILGRVWDVEGVRS